MKFKSALKYQLNDVKKPIIIFYIVIVSLMVLLLAGAYWLNNNVSGNVRIEMSFGGATTIFLFVVGLNAYKSILYMLTANGVSRKTMFVGFIVTALIVSAGMAIIDNVLSLLLRQLLVYDVYVFNTFETGFLMQFIASLSALMLGYLITTLYYRMSKPVKLLVSIGVPALLIIILPIMDANLFGHALSRATAAMYDFLNSSAAVAIGAQLVSIVLFGALAFLAIRRAPIKA